MTRRGRVATSLMALLPAVSAAQVEIGRDDTRLTVEAYVNATAGRAAGVLTFGEDGNSLRETFHVVRTV